MFEKLLVANRGEIACRIMRTARRLGIGTVAVYSDADAGAPHVAMADDAVRIGPAPAAQSYLLGERILRACAATGADALHPGYGFLSENEGFARACAEAGVTFVGPPPDAIAAMGDKIASKRLAAEAGVPTVPGHDGEVADAEVAVAAAEAIGFPVMLKASAGGGGKGMRVAHDAAEVREAFERARSEARSSFGDDRLLIEKFITAPRHIEVQVIADTHGNAVHLGERECSVQRRNQKVIEEAPSPFVDADMRAEMGARAVALAQAVGYTSAGTVEFIVDADRNFYFLEMNTRLQVEHPVTELVTGLDLVDLMIRIADGEALPFAQADVALEGWAVEARVYAEDPYRGFLPAPGRLVRCRPPAAVDTAERIIRNDTGVEEGGAVPPFYDPMISKLCAWAQTREDAIDGLRDALDGYVLEGIGHNVPFLSAVLGQQRFREGRLTTAYIAEEFPDGFSGADVGADHAALIVALAAILTEIGDRRINGNVEPRTWSVMDDGARTDVTVQRDTDGLWHARAEAFELEPCTVDWQPGLPLVRVHGEGNGTLTFQVGRTLAGLRVRSRGADVTFRVLPPHVADMMGHMPAVEAPDHGRELLSPMPGQVVRLDVSEGDRVEPGQPLAVVEAMKMENILRAERSATVVRIVCAVGAVVAVDEVILEFGDD